MYKTHSIETFDCFIFSPFPTFTSCGLQEILSSNMKLFRRYQQEILQRRETKNVLTTYRRDVCERNWERKSASHSTTVMYCLLQLLILRGSVAIVQVVPICFCAKVSPCIISEVWFCSEISLYRIPNEIFIIWLYESLANIYINPGTLTRSNHQITLI